MRDWLLEPETDCEGGDANHPEWATCCHRKGYRRYSLTVCTDDDSCRVPSHWQDRKYSGPHRDNTRKPDTREHAMKTVATASQKVFDADLDSVNDKLNALGAVVTGCDGFMFLDESKIPAALLSAYKGLIQYGYANGLL